MKPLTVAFITRWAIVACTFIAITSPVEGLLQNQGSRSTGVSARLQKSPNGQNIICGTQHDLIERVNKCANPLLSIIEGSMVRWPKTEPEIRELCDSFGVAERCIRDNARKCTKGIQRTVISTLANSFQKVRKQECSPGKDLSDIARTMMCLEKNWPTLTETVSNMTARLDAINRNQPTTEKKINHLCCVANRVEDELKQMYTSIGCAREGKFVIRLYRAVMQDVLDLICRQPHCNNLPRYQLDPNFPVDRMVPIIFDIVLNLDRI